MPIHGQQEPTVSAAPPQATDAHLRVGLHTRGQHREGSGAEQLLLPLLKFVDRGVHRARGCLALSSGDRAMGAEQGKE